MSEVAAALAALALDAAKPLDAPFPIVPKFSNPYTFSDKRLCNFYTYYDSSPQYTDSHVSPVAILGSSADWSALIGDVLQAIVKHLPAHAAQHAMLVCRQWNASVTHGLLQLRPRILNLHSISIRCN